MKIMTTYIPLMMVLCLLLTFSGCGEEDDERLNIAPPLKDIPKFADAPYDGFEVEYLYEDTANVRFTVPILDFNPNKILEYGVAYTVRNLSHSYHDNINFDEGKRIVGRATEKSNNNQYNITAKLPRLDDGMEYFFRPYIHYQHNVRVYYPVFKNGEGHYGKISISTTDTLSTKPWQGSTVSIWGANIEGVDVEIFLDGELLPNVVKKHFYTGWQGYSTNLYLPSLTAQERELRVKLGAYEVQANVRSYGALTTIATLDWKNRQNIEFFDIGQDLYIGAGYSSEDGNTILHRSMDRIRLPQGTVSSIDDFPGNTQFNMSFSGGGYGYMGNRNDNSNSLYRFDPATMSWQSQWQPVPDNRGDWYRDYTLFYDGAFYMLSNYNRYYEGYRLAKFVPTTGRWEDLPTAKENYSEGACFEHKGKLYYCNGRGVGAYNIDAGKWEEQKPYSLDGFSRAFTAFVIDDVPYVILFDAATSIKLLYSLDPETGQLSYQCSINESLWISNRSVVIDGKAYFISVSRAFANDKKALQVLSFVPAQ